jgi:hypothetical protein
MASRHFDSVNALTKRLINISGTFQCNGTSAPTVLTGSGFTVSRTGTGAYTIQLNDNYNAINSACAHTVQAAPADVVSVVAITNTTTVPGAQVKLLIGAFATPGSGADLTQTAPDCISFSIELRNSSIVS